MGRNTKTHGDGEDEQGDMTAFDNVLIPAAATLLIIGGLLLVNASTSTDTLVAGMVMGFACFLISLKVVG